jgi:hypothetical protein
MAQFQAEVPEIKKTKSVRTKSGALAYSYAPLDTIVKQVRSIIAKNGLSYKIDTIIGNGSVKSIVIVKHVAGYSESSEMEVPLGSKTDIMSNSQVTAAASTFSKRYAFCNAFGIMTGDGDDETQLKKGNEPEDVEYYKKKLHSFNSLGAMRAAFTKFPKNIRDNEEVVECANEVKELILSSQPQ